MRRFSASITVSTAASLLCSLILVSCNESFDARAPLDEQMVIFSVLSTDRTAQFVRVQSTYLPPGFNPLSYAAENSLDDAIVTIKASNGTYRMRDTLLVRPDTTRYKSPLHAFVLDPFTPEPGRSYEVIVQSTHFGIASASVVVPQQSNISISPEITQVLDHPETFSQDRPIIFIGQLSGNSKGYVFRLFLYYDVLKGSRWVEERTEVPISSSDSSSFSLDIPRYPQLAATPSTSQIGLMYRNGYYRAIINRVNSRYSANKIVFKWATFVVLQADRNLYEYYSITHADRDPFSIRLDQPMISQVDGGLGLVGAYTLDSLVSVLPNKFWGNR